MNRQELKKSLSILRNRLAFLNRDMQQQLLRQATHDPLTQLPNRVLFMDHAEKAIKRADQNKSTLAFLFLDLDRFKLTNDTLGHGMGDKLLQAVAERLLMITDESQTVARFGGDEFIILMPAVTGIQQAEQLARTILVLLKKPYNIEQYTLKITVSLGISVYPQDGLDYESLMKHADLSMYDAKGNGRNTYRVFCPEQNNRVLNRARLDTALRVALKKKEFHLVYQPLINMKENSVIGVEALIRWDSEFLGPVSPLNFIPAAEENGLIIDIGAWVLEQACMQLMIWHRQGLSALIVSVNVSNRQFNQPGFPELIRYILVNTGLPAQFLELEITEHVLLDNFENLLKTMHQLKAMGVKLSIDDFGTGYSNLSYLKQFPIDKLKIDQTFIMELISNNNNAAIVNAIISLAHSLKLEVLAEGIETEFQRKFILASHCDYGQGFFFQAPEKPELLSDFLMKYPNNEGKRL